MGNKIVNLKNINTKMKNYPTEDCVWMGVVQLSLKLKNFFNVLVFRKSCGTEYLFGFKTFFAEQENLV